MKGGHYRAERLFSLCHPLKSRDQHHLYIQPKDEADGFAGRFSEIYRSHGGGAGQAAGTSCSSARPPFCLL